MIVVDLIWKFEPDPVPMWYGRGSGILSGILFTVSQLSSTSNFVVTSNIRDYKTIQCTDVQSAKAEAQALFRSYAISQAIL